jgi:hypothetical protein
MEDKVMKFNSQICTTNEQSERLLALGLKKETADCQYAALVVDWKGDPISNLKWRFYDHNKGFIVQNFERIERIPAWSLHRLIEIANLPQYWECISGNWYEEVIASIQSKIHIGELNKEYLEE